MRIRRIYFCDWLDRVDMLLCMAIGRRSGSMQGIVWDVLYNAGVTPGEAVEALVEEYTAVMREESLADE